MTPLHCRFLPVHISCKLTNWHRERASHPEVQGSEETPWGARGLPQEVSDCWWGVTGRPGAVWEDPGCPCSSCVQVAPSSEEEIARCKVPVMKGPVEV